MVVQGNKISLSVQVAQTLKQRVRTGLYPSGNPLPSLRILSREFKVSQGVVQQAVRKLEENGIVKAHHGKGIMVEGNQPCEKTAIIFGVIHPYLNSMGFTRHILGYVDDAFAERSNFAIVRSSKDHPDLEREIAQHLVDNGARGLILWPASDDHNGEFFMSLARHIPVVLVDRLLPGAKLPTVVLDYLALGEEICEVLLNKMKHRRLLVLMDNLRISPYEEINQGIEITARRLERVPDVTVVNMALSRLSPKYGESDFSEVPEYARQVRQLLAEGKYDAMFCTQAEFADYVCAQSGLMDEFPGVRMATIQGGGPRDRSVKYTQLNCLEWIADSGRLISQAVDLVQRWVLLRQTPTEVVRLKMKMSSPRTGNPNMIFRTVSS